MSRARMVSVTGVQEWTDGELHSFDDYLVAEEPLEIRLGEQPLTVTMRTPGNDLELATGFLFTEGIVSAREQLASVTQQDSNRVRVELAAGVALDPALTVRNFYSSSSCGVCGKASIESVQARNLRAPNPHAVVDPELLCALPERLRGEQRIFGRTGALHAAGLFNSAGELLVLREDVGRHNAVDKVIGWAWMENRLPLAESVMMVSGRGGFEIVQKALVAGVAVLASVSAPSDLAVKLARRYRMTLIGFLRGRRFVVYSGAERLSLPVPAAA